MQMEAGSKDAPPSNHVLIFDGERGTGKSWLLKQLRHKAQEMTGGPALYIDLQPICQADPHLALWEVMEEVDRFVDGDFKQEQPSLLSDASRVVIEDVRQFVIECPLVILFDHVYESGWKLLEVLENYLLAPLAIEQRVLLVMAGRGKQYRWRTPELDVQVHHLSAFDNEEYTRKQIEIQAPLAVAKSVDIHRLGGGYPLHNYILGTMGLSAGAGRVIEELLAGVKQERREAIREILESVCVLKTIDANRVAYMLKNKDLPQPSDQLVTPVEGKEVQETILQELKDYNFVSWSTKDEGYVIDKAIQFAVQTDLKLNKTARWYVLHQVANRIYRDWIQQFPDSAQRWQPDLAYHEAIPYVSVNATKRLVGRNSTVSMIKDVIYRDTDSHIIYLEGSGGIGKTRILQHVLELPDGGDILFASGLIDLYEYKNHTIEGLIELIRSAFCDYPFNEYQQKLDELHEKEKNPIGREQINQARQAVINACLNDLQELSKKYRLVLAFDTLEILFFDDAVAQALGSFTGMDRDLVTWMKQEFFPAMQNTVLLFAGRPRSGKPQELLADLPGEIKVQEISLKGFNANEFNDYLNEVAHFVSEEEQLDVATEHLIRTLTQEERETLFACLNDYEEGQPTGVRPILLSLSIDYLVITGGELPYQAVGFSLGKAYEKEERQQIQQALHKELLSVLQKVQRPDDDLITYLACARKGMSIDLLALLMNLRTADGEWDTKLAESYFKNIIHLSFVKYREATQQIFLHDEMYDLIRKYLFEMEKTQEKVKRFYQVINDYYENRIKNIRERLRALTQNINHDRFLLNQEKASREAAVASQKEFSELWTSLRSMMIEHLHYQLHQDLLKGREIYSRYTNEAALADDDSLYTLLREELLNVIEDELQYAQSKGDREQIEEIERICETEIYPDDATRRLKRMYYERSKNYTQTALAVAELLSEGGDCHSHHPPGRSVGKV